MIIKLDLRIVNKFTGGLRHVLSHSWSFVDVTDQTPISCDKNDYFSNSEWKL